MAQLNKGIITNKGLELIAKSQAGTQIQFSRMATGDGSWPEGTNFLTATALKSEKQSIDISSIVVLSGDTVRVRGPLKNTGLSTGYFIREIGLFAQDPDVGEILYSITTAVTPDFFPADDTNNPAAILIDIQTTVSNADSVLAVFDPNAVVATAADLQEVAERVGTLEGDKIKRYGVRFSGSSARGTRVEDAVGMVANVAVDDELVVNDFDEVSFFNRPICCGKFDDDGNFIVHAYRGEPGFAWDGSKGEVMYEETPFWWKGDLHSYVSVTGTPIEGYRLSPRFKNGHDKEYSPVFWSGTVDGKATSRSGVFADYTSLNGHMDVMRNTHERAHTATMASIFNDWLLLLVEFATKDLQTVMMGASEMAYSSSNNYAAVIAENNVNRIIIENSLAARFVIGQTISIGSSYSNDSVAKDRVITSIVTYDDENKAIHFDGTPVDIAVGRVVGSRTWKNGATNIIRASSGSIVSNTDGRYPCIWRGKVDPWGGAYNVVCDILVQRTGESGSYKYTPYLLPDPTKYSNGVRTEDYIELGYEMATDSGYIREFGRDEAYPHAMLPTRIGASTTTYFSDYYYYPSSPDANGITVVYVGGTWINGRYSGPFSVYSTYSPVSSYLFRRARLFVTRK